MKTAVPVLQNRADSPLSGHFGSAPFFAIFDTSSSEPEFFDCSTRQSQGCAPVEELLSMNVSSVVCLGMGRGAIRKLEAAGIACRFPVQAPGRLDALMSAYSSGSLNLSTDSGVCVEHGDHNGDHQGHSGHCQH